MPAVSKPVEQLTPLGHALAGALGGVFSNAVVYPLDTVKTRIQAANVDSKNKGEELSIIHLLVRILKEEGIAGYYKGFGASMLNTFSMQYAYFFFYSFVRNFWMKRITRNLPPGSRPPVMSTATELILGAVAGALAQIFTIPVSVIATRQQIGYPRPSKRSVAPQPSTSASLSSSKPSRDSTSEEVYDDSFIGVAKEIIREEGVGGLWLGIKPGLVLTVNPAITYGVFERVKGIMILAKEKQGLGSKLTPWQAFIVGALSKTLATVVTYPYIMAKVRIQARSADSTLPHSKPDDPKHHHHPGALAVLSQTYRKEGILGWYQGMSAQITKAVLSQALLFMSKDQFEHYAMLIMVLLRRLSSH